MLQSALLLLPLGGCFITGEPPAPGLDIPARYEAAPPSARAALAATPSLDWWRGFRSRELTGIVERTRAANLDIAQAVARIVQADAQARITGAALLPQVGLGADASHARPSQSGSGGTSFGPSEHDNLSASLSASYEIDFWGKNRLALRAAEENAVASRFDAEVVALTETAGAADAYFQALAAQDRLRIAHDNVASAARILNLIKQQFAAGTASDLNVAQQESLVNTQRATIPPLEQALALNKNALALLLARAPEHFSLRGGSLDSIHIPRVTPGLPAELLAQRPDIREAEAQLAAAHANVAVARAQFLPSVTLTGEGGYQSAVLKTLLRPESALYTLAAGLTQPIFEGGRLTGNLEQQKGREEELLNVYRKAVLAGFTDVDNALIALRQTAATEALQREVVSSARRAFDLSEQQLRAGTINLVTLLQTEQTLFQAQDNLILARLAHLQAVVSLYTALGGGWLPKPMEAADAR